MYKVAVLGAGFVTKPAVDYFIDRCGYDVLVTSLNKSDALRLINGRPGGRALALSMDQTDLLDQVVSQADLVMSMVPPYLHLAVAQACIKHRTPMVTTSYISPEMEALDNLCREQGILILNEIGEDPGLDHMGSKRLIDHARARGGTVIRISSYGAGLPAFEHNDNPMGYKFSWSPKGMIMAAQAPAAYIERGRVIRVPASDLFHRHWRVELKGVGSFETYPNRDCTQYLKSFGLTDQVSFYRGILRNIGWCRTMKALADLGMLNTTDEKEFSETTYAALTAELIGANRPDRIAAKTARYLNVKVDSDLIKKLKWLGFFDDRQIERTKATLADILVDMMLPKMSYAPHEKDMVIVHNEVTAEDQGNTQKWSSTLMVEGEPGGDSAMSQAVSLPAAIASKMILQGKIEANGVQRPTLKSIYEPVLDEMANFGFRFKDTITTTNKR